ncbi:MAG TPA: 50S ribosomal protein L6 [Pirellulaceae bacterium]|mgnify:CR=1 FL=1|nr:50S ribosomal protein L6 [Pirellulaceae bacterium]
MSRIGKLPVAVPAGVTVKIEKRQISISGPKGNLNWTHRPELDVQWQDASREIVVTPKHADRQTRALHGLTRAILANMVEGVTQGYEKKLELQGVGYVCSLSGNLLTLRVGLANELKRNVPEGLQVECPDQTHINVRGCDKQLVGQFAAEIRSLRKPEPYKGKGIRYVGEHIKIKPGKSAT